MHNKLEAREERGNLYNFRKCPKLKNRFLREAVFLILSEIIEVLLAFFARINTY